MHHALVKLVAVLLLIVQGVSASVKGRELCIHLVDCGSHGETSLDSACGHDHSHDHGHDHRHDGHHHGDDWSDELAGAQIGCNCHVHVHVPVPDEERVPGKTRLSIGDFKTVVLPALVVMVLQWEPVWRDGLARYAERREARSWDQLGALRTTRLLE